MQYVMRLIGSLQTNCQPLVYQTGFSSLPDELLIQIFESSYLPSELIRTHYTTLTTFPVNLSHVCRRFRDVTLKTPSIWTALSNSQHPDQLNAFLLRSKSSGLYLSINERAAPLSMDNFAAFLQITIPHAARWKEVKSVQWPNTITEAMESMSGYPDLALPSLRSLELTEWGTDLGEYGLGSEQLFLGRYSPHLSHLKLLNVIPAISFGGTLTSCDVSLESCGSTVWDLQRLREFLAENLQLENFSIKFVNTSMAIPREPPRHTSLPRLRSLSIHIGQGIGNLVSRLSQTIHAPNLIDLTLDLDIPTDEHTLGWFPDPTFFPSAQHLTLRDRNEYTPDSLFPMALSSLSKLKSVSVEAPHLCLIHRVLPVDDWPSLRTLRFIRCDKLDIYSVQNVVEQLSRNRRKWDLLEKLEIRNCRGVSANRSIVEQLKLRMGDKFVFIEWDRCKRCLKVII